MSVTVILVHPGKLPDMDTYECMAPHHTVGSNLVACFFVHSRQDIETIESYQGPYQKEVRAMADDLHKLFPAEPEAEPEDEYVLRYDDYDGKAILCGDCGFLIETRWFPEDSQHQCKVCIDLKESGGFKQMNHQTNTILAEIRKSRGELATPAELQIRKLNRNHFGKLREMRGAIKAIAARGIARPSGDEDVAMVVSQYVFDLLDIEEPKEA